MRDEFVEFAQFLTVMNFLTNTVEGQQISKRADVEKDYDKTQQLIGTLIQDPSLVGSVMQQLPKAFCAELASTSFSVACDEAFLAAAGGADVELGYDAIVDLVEKLDKDHPYKQKREHYEVFTTNYLQGKSRIRAPDFYFLVRYVIIMSYLQYQSENQGSLVANVMMGEEKLQRMLDQLKKGADTVWDMVPFIPTDLTDALTSKKFEEQCDEDFRKLDEDNSGVLEPMELLPVLQALTEAHSLALTESHCIQFVDIFDVQRNGVITRQEFVQFVRFMMIMAFLETEEGQQVSLEAEVSKGTSMVEGLLRQLEKDRTTIQKVMSLLPEDIFKQLTSDEFVLHCRQVFSDLDKDKTGVLRPHELIPVIVDMSSAKAYAVTREQCERFTTIFDLHGDGVLRPDEFLDFARFVFVMNFLKSEEGKAQAEAALKVMGESKRIDDLIDTIKKDRQAVAMVVPYLPDWLRNDLLSDHFVSECRNFFTELDKDKSGSLDPSELFPVILSLAETNKMALDSQQCKQFSELFDDNQDNLISIEEFVNFARFIIVMGFLDSKEGQDTLASAHASTSPPPPPPGTAPALVSAGSLGNDCESPMRTAPIEITPSMMEAASTLGGGGPTSPAHLAVDLDFYKDKSEKLTNENDAMRQRMNNLEDLVRKMQTQMEEQAQRLRHAEVDLQASRSNLR
eukprot:TRINITY_DN18541_c0_g1_i1.p1 TRINITY_DN18541_c0_g1~~TRINITY_DN18541_c0_g1_i1.p1  ORF type:complete len:681 (-),score=174.89 TRINITY_DN18541_c0_g1_i1:94-2136(-)